MDKFKRLSSTKDAGVFNNNYLVQQNSEIDTEQDTEYVEETKTREKKHKSSSSADEETDDHEDDNKPWSFGEDSAGTGGFGRALSNSFEAKHALLDEESDEQEEPKKIKEGGIKVL